MGLTYTLRNSLQTASTSPCRIYTTSKQYFEQPAASLLFDFH